MDWFQTEKGVYQGCIFSPCLFNLYTEHIIQNAKVDESQAGIKIDGRNNNSIRYADDITSMAEIAAAHGVEKRVRKDLVTEQPQTAKVRGGGFKH